MKSGNYPIVLTADRTLMSEYNSAIFLGFSACVPKGIIPDRLYFSLFCPPIKVNKDGSVDVAHCGTRKIEAALINYGFDENDVFVAHPEHLDKAIGSKTKAVGITEHDPLGIGPATSTFTDIFGGEAYMAVKFKELLNHPSIKRFKPKIIAGGPGAWQLEGSEIRKELRIDTVVIGEGEKVAGPLFEKAVNDEPLPEVVYGEPVEENEIPIIKKATLNGIVEIARGCGRGCDFCVPTLQRFRCVKMDNILKEVEINLRAGRQPLLHAEDVLRYKAHGIEVNKQAVIDLFRTVKNYPGVKSVGISHFALASVASAPEVVEEISNILDVHKKNWISGQTGIETGSPKMIERHMKGKCKPFAPKDWPQVVFNAFQILAENNWVPCCTVILGLPGETEEDLDLTISLVEKLRPFKSLIVPLFFVAMGGLEGKSKSFTLDDVTPKYAELMMKCWKHNFVWFDKLFKDFSNMSIRNKITKKGLSLVFSYAVNQGMKFINICEKEYDYDLHALIRDYKNGNLRLGSLPIQLLRAMTK